MLQKAFQGFGLAMFVIAVPNLFAAKFAPDFSEKYAALNLTAPEVRTSFKRIVPSPIPIHTFSEQSPNGCIDSVIVAVQPVHCYSYRTGSFRVLEVFGGLAPHYFSIDNQTFSTNPLFDRLSVGTYTLYVRDSLGCQIEKTIVMPEPPELRVTLRADADLVEEGDSVTLSAKVAPAGTELNLISWRPPDLFSSMDSLTQRVQVPGNTMFAIRVATGPDCTADAHVFVNVRKSHVYVPNTFLPESNQDAYFTVYAGEGIARVVSLRVYNRWGIMLFERKDFLPNDPFQGWDGKYFGKRVVPGVYLWTAEIEYVDGRKEFKQGDVSVMRGEN